MSAPDAPRSLPVVTGGWQSCRVAHPDVPGLGDLVAEAGLFFGEVHGRRPHLSRGEDTARDPRRFADPAVLWDDAMGRHLRAPGFRMVRAGRTLPRSRTCRTVGYGNTNLHDALDARAVRAAYADGATMVLQGLHFTDPRLGQLANNLALALDQPTQINAYLSPEGASGLDVHFDFHDVFVVQLAGRKRWRVWEPLPRTEVPVKGGPHGPTSGLDELGEPLVDTVLGPGDVLYTPRGFPHVAETMEESSSHLTIGMPALTWERVMQGAVRRGVRARALREGLPAGLLGAPLDADGAGATTTLDATGGDPVRLPLRFADPQPAAAALLDTLDESHLRRWVAREIWDRQPQTRVPPLEVPEMRLDRAVRVTPGPLLWCGPAPDEPGRLELGLGAAHLTMPDEATGFLAHLFAAPHRFVAGDAPVELDGATRLVVLRRLAREGVITPVPAR